MYPKIIIYFFRCILFPARVFRSKFVLFGILSIFFSYSHAAFAQNIGANCPSSSFAEFIRIFSERPDIQERFSKRPLIYEFYDWDSKTKIPFMNNLKIDDFSKLPIFDGKFIFPNQKDRLNFHLKQAVKKNGISYEVTLAEPDTDNIIVFLFNKNDDCWLLTSISNLNPS